MCCLDWHKSPVLAQACCKHAIKDVCDNSGDGKAGAQTCAGFLVPLPCSTQERLA